MIGKQALALDIEPNTFRKEIARARTFGFMKDVANCGVPATRSAPISRNTW